MKMKRVHVRPGVQALHQLDDRRRRLVQCTRVERRWRVVFDAELHALCKIVARDARRERERHVDARRHAGRGHELACSTTRRPVGIAPYSARRASDAQASSSLPPAVRPRQQHRTVQTDVVHVVVASTCGSIPASVRRLEPARCESAGTTSTSALVTSASACRPRARGTCCRSAPHLCRARRTSRRLGQALGHLVRPDDVECGLMPSNSKQTMSMGLFLRGLEDAERSRYSSGGADATRERAPDVSTVPKPVVRATSSTLSDWFRAGERDLHARCSTYTAGVAPLRLGTREQSGEGTSRRAPLASRRL